MGRFIPRDITLVCSSADLIGGLVTLVEIPSAASQKLCMKRVSVTCMGRFIPRDITLVCSSADLIGGLVEIPTAASHKPVF